MLKGTSRLYVKQTEGDEWGIYHVNEEGYFYLAFAFDNMDEAIEKGQVIAKLLGVKFGFDKSKGLKFTQRKIEVISLGKEDPHIAEGEDVVKEEKPWFEGMINHQENKNDKVKLKKVSGVGKLCRELICQGKSGAEIIGVLTQKYLDVGRSEKDARWFAQGVLDWEKKGIKNENC